MDGALFDEFGNFLGDVDADFGEEEAEAYSAAGLGEPLSSEGSEGEADEDHRVNARGAGLSAASVGSQIVLHEDKQYFPRASDVYGDETETLVQEEDTQLISQPIIAGPRTKVHSYEFSVAPLTEADVRAAAGAGFADQYEDLPPVSFDRKELASIGQDPASVRCFAVIGHLHHGKTTLMDLLIEQTHPSLFSLEHAMNAKRLRATDFRHDEVARGLSIKCASVALLLSDLEGTKFAFHMIDTPGHVNFSDEQCAAMRLCDGVLLVVDAVEGVMGQTVRSLRHAVREDKDVVVVINKVDRLMLELRLPPADAFHKLRLIIDEINAIIAEEAEACGEDEDGGRPREVSPELGTVCFASSLHGWIFSLQSFAKLYSQRCQLSEDAFDAALFARRLWGDWYCEHDDDSGENKFTRKPHDVETPRTFVQFILEPLYKLYAHLVGEDPENAFPEFQELHREALAEEGIEGDEVPSLVRVLDSLGLNLKKSEFTLDSRPLLKLCCQRLFGTAAGLVEMCRRGLPSPLVGIRRLAQSCYRGPLNGEVAHSMIACRQTDAPLVVHITKLLARSNGEVFDALGRVLSGTLYAHSRVRVLGESFVPEDAMYVGGDPDDETPGVVGRLWFPCGRYRMPVGSVPSGSLCLIEGVAEHIAKTAVLTNPIESAMTKESVHTFLPLRFDNAAVCKIAVEPLQPRELPKMLDGLRALQKSYPLLETRVEESGEHVILGTGELQLDCALRDLREVHSEVEVRVSEPSISLRETISETSALKCFGETPNGAHRLAMIAQPLTPGLAEAIEIGAIPSTPADRRVVLQEEFGWDLLAARSVWCFGPDPENGPNILCDDTLPGTTAESRSNKKRLVEVAQHSIVRGFQWAVREGPLCEEPMRACQFRLVDASISARIQNMGSVVPISRRVAYSAALTAQPRLMEPIFVVEMLAPQDCVAALYDVVQRRRGHVIEDAPQAGTPLYTLKALVPVLDSYGFETDLRAHTLGQAFCQSHFSHWDLMPGDPLDRSIILAPLEPSPPHALARELMVKTRRRKGLTEDVVARKFFDDTMLSAIEQLEGLRF